MCWQSGALLWSGTANTVDVFCIDLHPINKEGCLDMARKNQPIDLAAARRALYLDFEGNAPTNRQMADPPPVLAGVLCEGEYQLSIVDKGLAALTEKDSGEDPGYECVCLDTFLEELVRRARDESRRIVFWTAHERDLFEERGYPPGEIGYDVRVEAKPHFTGDFQDYKARYREYVNPDTAKSKKKQLRPTAHGLLTQITATIGLDRPELYGAGLVGKWIKHMRKHSKKGAFQPWPRGAKAAASKLIKHNKHDCEATQFLLEHLLNNKLI